MGRVQMNPLLPGLLIPFANVKKVNFNGKWCRDNVDNAVVGISHIALLTAKPGSYDDCTMTLTDSPSNRSQPLKISPFVVVECQS